MHDNAYDDPTRGTTRQMQRRTFLHPRMLHQPPLREEIRRQLHAAPEPRPHARRPDPAIQAPHALRGSDLPQSIDRVAVPVLRADGQGGGVALQAGLDEEEGGARGGAEDAGGGAGEDVDAEGLDGGVGEEEAGAG